MKPHIKYDGFGWVCHSEDYFHSGYGMSPIECFDDWELGSPNTAVKRYLRMSKVLNDADPLHVKRVMLPAGIL